ncbi:glycosyltransferase [Pseudoalteromonas sp. A25]|uniref:glycosyltransferase n=1 Tax=Pseudoalteromonas sp. A25 TaxID=116092 RepID=UPI0012610279|nr:glycosyltransferase [Pseudoalteromonas sp. A25]
MKVAYLLVLKNTQYHSVYDKVIAQLETWRALGVDAKLFLVTPEANEHPHVEVIAPDSTIKLIRKLKHAVDCFNPDIVYHRMWVLSPLLVPLLLSDYKMLAEINTDTDMEISLEKSRSIKGFATYIYNALTKAFYQRRLAGAVSVTKELSGSVSTQQVAVIPNSIAVEGFNYRKSVDKLDSKLSVLFVGTPGLMWHGIDILNQLARETKGRLEFHVVGMEQSVLSEPSENIHFYGYLPVEQYAAIAQSCSVGLGTLALHRKGMKEACPLKVREYLAAGLPVILPYEETAFLEHKPDWVLEIDSSKDRLDKETVEKVVEFTNLMHNVIIDRQEAAQYIGNVQLESKRVEFMQALAGVK